MPVTPVVGRRVGEARLVGPLLDADDPEARLERLAVDPDPLDGARRGALAAADLGALEGGAGRRRRGEQEVAVAEDDLGVRADVDDELDDLALVGRLGEDHAGGVGADVAGDARQDVDAGTRMGARDPAPRPGRRRPGRSRARTARDAERDRVDAEHEVMHDRVADDRELEDLVAARRRRSSRAGRSAR